MTPQEILEMEQRIKEAQTLCDGFDFPETDLIHRLPLPTPFGDVLNEAAAKINFDSTDERIPLTPLKIES